MCEVKKHLWVVYKSRAVGPFPLVLGAVESSNLSVWELYGDFSYLIENVENWLQLALLHILM